MSLQVWLPLNREEVRNQGLADVTITNSGATYTSTEGKIGGSYYFNGSSRIQTTLPSTMTTIKNTTVAAWVKSISSTLALGGISHDSTPDYYAPGCTLYSSGWQTGTGSSWAYVSGGTVANTSVWHHVACVIDNTDVTTYLDGVQVATKTLAAWGMTSFDLGSGHFIEIGSDFPGGNEYLTGYINDFRVYNNALSAKEVKKLSQGLILHYPLNRRELGQENMITNSIFTSDPWASAITGTIERDGKQGYIIANYTLYNKTSSGTTTIFPGLTYEENTQYTFSWKWRDDYRTDGKSSSLYLRIKHTDGSIIQKISSLDYNYWKEEILTSTAGKTIDSILTTYGNGGNLLITDLKLEKGATKTTFSPFPNSKLYNTIGLNDNIEYDTSGFSNHGIKIGTFNYLSDTSKYHVSTYFNGSSYFQSKFNTNLSGDLEFTVSFWIKADAFTNDYASVVWNGYSGTNSAIAICIPSGRVSLDFWNNRYLTDSVVLTSNNWHHVCCTKQAGVVSTSNSHIYINGQEVTATANNYSTTAPNIYGSYKWIIGRLNDTSSRYITGKVSDVRVYATALSAEDVLALYNNKNF